MTLRIYIVYKYDTQYGLDSNFHLKNVFIDHSLFSIYVHIFKVFCDKYFGALFHMIGIKIV